MSEESETVLRNSLDAVDRFRRRAIAAVAILFVATVVGLASLMGSAAARVGGNAGQTKILFTSAASQMVFVTLCTVVVALFITRMTKTILRAIELMSQAPPK
jgi:hypothetical protein